MLALLFLLLPVAVAYGWYMGSRSTQQKKQRRTGKLSRQYVTGLNFLLSDQPDKAVDLFIELLEVDKETIDTHLALGNLFRKRGEVDRAIRIHQNLIARPSLSFEHRSLAMMQLAKDYVAAGLYDRAEVIFDELTDDPDHEVSALKQLLCIYQRMKEWKQAIAVANRLIKAGDKGMSLPLGHFHCELGLLEARQNNEKKALTLFKRALSIDPNCVRANIESAKALIKLKQFESAVEHLTAIIKQDPNLVSETVFLLKVCFSELGERQALEQYLRAALAQGAGMRVAIELAQQEAERVSNEAALALIQTELKKQPTLTGFHALMEFHLKGAEEGSAKNSLQLLKEIVADQVRLRPAYRCTKCGFSSQALNWQCPSCRNWGKVKPIRGLDGE